MFLLKRQTEIMIWIRMAPLRRYVQCKADPFQNLNRGFVKPPSKLGREWIAIFHRFV